MVQNTIKEQNIRKELKKKTTSNNNTTEKVINLRNKTITVQNTESYKRNNNRATKEKQSDNKVKNNKEEQCNKNTGPEIKDTKNTTKKNTKKNELSTVETKKVISIRIDKKIERINEKETETVARTDNTPMKGDDKVNQEKKAQNDNDEDVNNKEPRKRRNHNLTNEHFSSHAVPKQKQMLILCDKSMKSLASYIKQNTVEYKSILSICKPGAPLKEIVKEIAALTKSMNDGDDIIVLSTNEFDYNIGYIRFVRDYCKSRNFKLQIASLSYRTNNSTYQKISKINKQLYDMVSRSPGMKIIDVNSYNKSRNKIKSNRKSSLVWYLYKIIVNNSKYEYTHTYKNLVYLTEQIASPVLENNRFFLENQIIIPSQM